MTRAGLNGTLSYVAPSGAQVTFAVRVSGLVHDLKPIYAESSGRNRRVLYPHRMSSAQFAVDVILVGQAERQAFTAYLSGYTAALLDPSTGGLAAMSVSVPVRGFSRQGVPLTGAQWGDRVGQVVFRPRVVFETAAEPLDTDPDPAVSSAPAITAVGDANAQYFYPFGTQLSGDQVPAGSAADVWIPPQNVTHRPDPASWGN